MFNFYKSSFTPEAKYYEIIYYPTKEPEFDAGVTLHGHGITKTIEDLMPNTVYTFKIRAIMSDNAHTDWATAGYTTGEGCFNNVMYSYLNFSAGRSRTLV